MTPSPQTPSLRQLTPPDPPMLPFALGGTVVWLVLGVVFVLMRSTLAAHGREGWIGISFSGAALGVVGIIVMALHDRNRARRLKIQQNGENS